MAAIWHSAERMTRCAGVVLGWACLWAFLSSLIAAGVPETAESVAERSGPAGIQVPILLYHRFGPVVADGMTVTTTVFESQLRYLKDNGYVVIPLAQLVDYMVKKGPAPPARSVVIVADDGHRTVYTDMLPLVKRYGIPVTLFIYPSAISNADYAMTWDQVRELKRSGLFDIQSHSYWHPNFKKDRRRMSSAEYEKTVHMQLSRSRDRLEKELGSKVDMLAWPFGIYDEDLIRRAREAGYRAAFSIERRHVVLADDIMALPRYIVVDADRGRGFEMLLKGSTPRRNISY